MLWECFGLLAVLGFLLYKWSTATFKTFERRGIPYEKPFPLLGNGKGMLKKDYAVMRSFRELYKRNKQHKIFGFFNMREPIFFIHDPEFIKKLCIKDFEYFVNRNSIFEGSNEPLMENMILNLKDQRWKSMRTTLTPAFTAAKMRSMFTLMQESFDQSLAYLDSQSKDGQPFELELKECFSRLSNDIIASTAFGLKVNSYADSENKFFKLGQSITNYKGAMLVKMMLMSTAPWLAKLLGLKIFNAELTDYFMRLVCDAMKYRKENNIVRPDMIQLLMEAQKEASQQLDDVHLVAQCFIFFFAAFENNANLISTTSMELMYHPDIQQRLYDEVLALHHELNGEQLNYDSVSKMKYMDMVVNEALRKNPLSVMIDRVCSKDYKLYDDENNLVFEFKPGDYLWFPVLGLASDEEYFENPAEFNPERFSDENKQNIRPCTHFPFGLGPRSCIGNRYAMMQVKAMLYYLVLNYKFERAEKSPESMYAGIEGFTPVPKNCWIRFVPREAK